MPLATGQNLSFYEVLGPLGAGSMGEVYRARDTRLEREVALKVLPDELAGDEERLQRFEREAKTLASLSHPNVATVYGIDQEGDTCFMAMELVAGEDLAERLDRGALPVAEALDVCGQIAAGLEAAHEAGVIHRDMKPANVRITPESRVKLLDFGLAKPVEARGSGSSLTDSVLSTGEGRLLGTPTYMAPEQARGKPIDRRVDVWAFGCVLFECLAGRRAFDGETMGDVLAAVLDKEPDWSRLPARTPAHVRDLLGRCLDKDPRTRLRDVGEARILLEKDTPASSPAPPHGIGARPVWPYITAIAFSAIGGIIAIFAIQGSRPTGPTNPLARATKFEKLIDWPDTEFDAAISRNGELFAFVSDRDGQLDAWVGLIDGGMPRNLTNGKHPTWSLKVRDVYFDLEAANVCVTYLDLAKRIDVMSGVERFSPLGKYVVNPAWSPDGTRIAFHLSNPDGDPLYVGDADGQNRGEPISVLEEGMHQHYPIWSPDGEWIYVTRGWPATHMDLWRISPDGKVEEQLTTGKGDVAYPTPIDADTVLFVAHEDDGTGPWLWVLDVPSGSCERATIGVEHYLSVAASLDGKRLVATVSNPTRHLLSVPILADREAVAGDIEPVSGLENVYGFAPRFDRDGNLYFLSSGGIWHFRDGESVPVLPAEEAAGLAPPAVSPEGESLAVVSRKRGRPRLHVVSPERVVGPALSDTLEVHGAPTWSPDGDWIAVGGTDEDGEGLFKLPAGGGPPERIADGHALNPVWSPAGDLIVYAGLQSMAYCPLLAVTPDGEPVELPDIRVLRLNERMRFLPDGSGLVYMQGHHAGQDFWLLDMETLESKELTRFEGIALVGEMRTFDVDPTGKRIVFDQLKLNSDIVLIELEDDAD